MNQKIELLKPYEFNKEFFDDLKGDDYDSLKEDIIENGIKVDLHITKSNTILCGHQRWNIAKELGLDEVPVKIVEIDESDENKVKEYVIKDNLLRRHLVTEQKYILIATLSEVYEVGRGAKEFQGNQYTSGESPTSGHTAVEEQERDDVLVKTAKATGVSKSTVASARKYTEIIKASPELKKKKVSEVLNNYEIKDNKVVRKNTRIETNLEKINPYDSNMFHFTNNKRDLLNFNDEDESLGYKFKEVICVNVTHGENDVRYYSNYYPTVLTMCCFVDRLGKEFSLRDYARVQDFPEDFKFVGTSQEIKRQIGEAVSPKMGEYIIKKYIKGKDYVELFSGCGGFSVGAHKLGKKCLWCNDFNKYSGHSFKLNFPDTNVFIGDVKDINEKKIHKEIGYVDFIIGGPPCQGFSSAGQRLGFKGDSRNNLYLDFLRFIKEFKPKQFIMENVKEIEIHKEEIIKDFKKIGYNVKTELVNGLDIGMKQKRIRVFFIGLKMEELKEDGNKRG